MSEEILYGKGEKTAVLAGWAGFWCHWMSSCVERLRSVLFAQWFGVIAKKESYLLLMLFVSRPSYVLPIDWSICGRPTARSVVTHIEDIRTVDGEAERAERSRDEWPRGTLNGIDFIAQCAISSNNDDCLKEFVSSCYEHPTLAAGDFAKVSIDPIKCSDLPAHPCLYGDFRIAP